MRILALDIGTKRIGVAVSDPLGVTAKPHGTILRNKEASSKITSLVRELEIQKVVIGLPLHLDGTESEQAKDVRSFASKLSSHMAEIPIEFYDERLTSVEADEMLGQRKLHWRKRKEQIDAFAASIMLQSYLNRT